MLAESEGTQVGTFLLRFKESEPSILHVAVLEAPKTVRHHQLDRKDGKYIRSDRHVFSSLDEFLEAHQAKVHVFACKLTNLVAPSG